MRRIFFITGFLICGLKLCAQQVKDEFKIMVDSAISIKYLQVAESIKDGANKDYFENLYLLNEQDQPLNYLSTSNKLKFKSINIYDNRNRKIIKKVIYAWKVFAVLNKNQLIVNIVDFYITYKAHNYNYANGGGSKTIFEYSCDEKKWKLISFQNRGN